MPRLLDLTLATLALLLFSPLMFLIALALFLSQRKVFFFQQRPGLHEKPFTLCKFSTMRDAAEGEDEAANQQARLTLIGKFLRKWSLDELPQLLNVIRGDMALVGPRPLLMDYLEIYTEEERHRHEVKPGITGWAQIHGRNYLPFKQRFQYDLWYVRNRNLWLDVKILFLTIWKVFQREGVYANATTTSPKFDGTN